MRSGNRTIIVHNHLFKNAGSSIDWALNKNFGRAFIDHRDDQDMRKGAEYLGPYLEQHDRIAALSSHHLTLPLPVLENTELLHMLMFRHPIERVSSVYYYERKQVGSSTPGAMHARKLDLEDYIIWRMRPDVGPTIRNFHAVRLLPPLKAGHNITQSMEQAARDELASMPLLGLVERFDESMVLFEETLRPFFPDIDMSYKRQNVNQDQKLSQDDRIEALRGKISDEAYQLLLENNAIDIRLYEYATELFEDRLMNTPDFSIKLAAFKERCASKH